MSLWNSASWWCATLIPCLESFCRMCLILNSRNNHQNVRSSAGKAHQDCTNFQTISAITDAWFVKSQSTKKGASVTSTVTKMHNKQKIPTLFNRQILALGTVVLCCDRNPLANQRGSCNQFPNTFALATTVDFNDIFTFFFETMSFCSFLLPVSICSWVSAVAATTKLTVHIIWDSFLPASSGKRASAVCKQFLLKHKFETFAVSWQFLKHSWNELKLLAQLLHADKSNGFKILVGALTCALQGTSLNHSWNMLLKLLKLFPPLDDPLLNWVDISQNSWNSWNPWNSSNQTQLVHMQFAGSCSKAFLIHGELLELFWSHLLSKQLANDFFLLVFAASSERSVGQMFHMTKSVTAQWHFGLTLSSLIDLSVIGVVCSACS